MAEVISFETGLKSFSLNDNYELTFNPTDSAFVEGLFNTFDALDSKQEAYKAEIENADKREIFDIARKRDAEMREMIDKALGGPVCGAVFGAMNVYAMADGFPVWANLLLAVMDKIDASFVEERARTNPRLEKYTKKYRK